MADSDSGSDIAPENIVPKQYRYQHIYDQFRTEHGLAFIRSLDQLYSRHETVRNGHCAPDAMIMGLHAKGKLRPRIGGGVSHNDLSDRDRREDLKLWRKQICNERKALRNHYISNMYHYRGNENDPRPHKIVTPDGEPFRSFKGSRRTLMNDNADRFYQTSKWY